MGEKIKVINNVYNMFDIELNKATIPGGPRYIHVQNDKVRFCVTERDFLQMSVSIRKAIDTFKHNKGIK